MAEVERQLLRDIEPGDRFGEIATGDVVFSLIAATIAFAWAITGALIVRASRGTRRDGSSASAAPDEGTTGLGRVPVER
jgi:hypothetical protein